MFHEVRMNSYSIDAIFGEDSDAFSQPEIIGLDQRLLKLFSNVQNTHESARTPQDSTIITLSS